MPLVAVAPILPTAQSLLLIMLLVFGSALTAAASLLRPAGMRLAARFLWRQKWSVTVIALLIVGVWFAISRIMAPGGDAQGNASRRDASEWPMFRGNLARTGATGKRGPIAGSKNWHAARGEAFYSSPVITGPNVYCVSSRGNEGRIDCRSAETGALLWSTAPPSYTATISSPVVAGDYLVVGEGLHSTRRGRVVCIDLHPDRAGNILWTYTTNSHVECTPVIAGNRVYVNAGDDGVYCFALEPQPNSAQQLVWHVSGDRCPDAETSLAVVDDRVYVGLGHGGSALVMLDAATGRELARLGLPYPVFAPPAISGNKLYVGLGRGDFLNFTTEPAGQVVCIDLHRFTVDWSFETPSTVLGAIVAEGEEIYFGCTDGRVYALNPQGQQVGVWDSGAPITASLACTDRHLYVVNYAGHLTALDRRWLVPVWHVVLGEPGNYISSPAVVGGRVFVGTPEDGLLCLGDPPPAIMDELWPGTHGGPGAAGCRDESALPAQGAQLWHWTLGGEGARTRIEAPIAAAGRWLAVPIANSDSPGVACLQLDRDDRAPHLACFIGAQYPVRRSPALRGAHIYFTDAPPDNASRATAGKLYCADRTSGSVHWTRALAPDASGIFIVTARDVLVQDKRDTLTALDAEGQPLWSVTPGELAAPPWVDEARIVLAVEAPPALEVRDRAGALLWHKELVERPTTSPVVDRRRIWLGTQRGMRRYDLLDGREQLRLPPNDTTIREPLWINRQRDCVAIAGEQLLRYGSDGSTTLIPDAIAAQQHSYASFVAAANGLLLVDGQELLLLPTGEATPRPWSSLAGFGPPTHAVLHNGCVFCSFDGHGLVALGAAAPSGESAR